MTNYFEVDKVITCSGTAPVASTAVDIYAIKVGKDQLLMKRLLAVSGGNWTTTMTVPKTYVSPFGEVYLKVVDSYNPTIAGTKFYTIDPTLTIDAITGMVAGVQKAITGTSNYVGQHIEVEVRLSGETPEDAWTPFGTATVAGDGSWTVSGTIASADTYDFRVIDENIDPAICFAQVDDVVVASGSLKIQLDSVNCDFYTVDSCAVGTDKIAILGYATVTDRTALASIEGVTICGANVCTTNGNTVSVSVLYNLNTKAVVWIKSHFWNVGNEHIASEYDTPNAKAIVTDGTNVFYPYSLFYKVGSNSIFKFYLAKVAVSDGTLTSSAEILSANQAGALSPAQVYTKVSLTMLGDYIYMMYNPNPLSNASTSSAIGLRITKSDLTLGSATNLTGIMTYSEHNFCDNDGTYIYWMSWNSTTGYSYVMRTNADMSGLTTATTITISGASYPRGFVINGSQRIYSVSEGANSRTSDGTNSYAALGKPSITGTYLHLKPGITHTEKTIKQLSTVDLTETWSKDYTADNVTGVNKIEKVGDNYYVTGHSIGDFDGDHAANTKSCLIIGKINISNGDL